MVSTTQINFRENSSTTQFIKHILQTWNRMAISNSDIIYSSTIYAHTPCTIFLRNQNNRHSTRAKADTNIPFIQKCLYLLLNFLRLLGIGPVWCPVRKCSTQYKVNLVLNTTQWWQTRWYLRRKHIIKILQNSRHHRRKRSIIVRNQNLAFVHKHKWHGFRILTKFSHVCFGG